MALSTLPSQRGPEETGVQMAPASGFSLHAGATTEGCERANLERLFRYIIRPATSKRRLSIVALKAHPWCRPQ